MMEFIKGMPGFMFFFITAFAFGLAIAAFIAGLKSKRRAALVKDMPTSNIGMAADGYIEFEGRVDAVDGPPLLSPLTRQPVAWYHATVERYVGKSKNSTGDGWATVKDRTSGAPLLLRDATGVCAVHPWGADVTATDKSLWYGATVIPADRSPAKVDAKESTSRAVTIEGTADTRFRYYEERIYTGDPLLVLGTFHRGRFDADEDEEDADEEDADELDEDEPSEDEPPEDEEEAALDREWNDDPVADDLTTRIGAITPAWVGSAPGKPFIVSTRLQAVEITEADMSGKALRSIALLPLAIGLLLLYARFG